MKTAGLLSKPAPNWRLFIPFSCYRALPHLCSPLSSGSRHLAEPEPVCRGLQGADVGLAVGERGGAPGVLLPGGPGHGEQGMAGSAPAPARPHGPWHPWEVSGSGTVLMAEPQTPPRPSPVVHPDPSLLSHLRDTDLGMPGVVGHCWSTWRRAPDACPNPGTQEGPQEAFPSVPVAQSLLQQHRIHEDNPTKGIC